MKLIPNSVTQSIGRQILMAKKQSPHILFAAGVVGVLAGTVLACRATLKAGPILDEFQADIEGVKAEHQIRQGVVFGETGKKPTEGDYRKDLAYVYLRDSAKVVWLYAPAVVVSGLSLAALTGSHVTLVKRNTALTGAFVALTNVYSEYRDRVKAEIGEEREQELHLGLVREKSKDAEGKAITKLVRDPNKFSLYARCFDEYNPNWKKTNEYNRMFLLGHQNYFNHLLQARGHVFLNEVYEALGFEHSQAGQIVGWVISDAGDCFVDFGIFERDSTRFVNGWEPSIWLDFNVDGVIWDKIGG